MHRRIPPPRSTAARGLAVALALAVPPLAGAQAPTVIPAHEPLNPAVVARSGLQLLPIVPRAPELALGFGVEYGSAVERNLNWPDSYLLDAELLRLRVALARDVGRHGFVRLDGGLTGSYAGFADRFFERYHALIDFTMEERDARPRNRYADRLSLAARGVRRERAPRGLAPSDLRLTAGVRGGERWQTALAVTLPTAPQASPFARGTATVGVLQALRVPAGERVVLEATGGVGYSPRHGELRDVQRTLLHAAGASAHLRVWGAHAVYGTLFHHSAPYRGTGFPELDAAELSADFGYQWYSRSGRVWRVGLTEDIQRRDPGIDLVLKVSVEG